MRVGEQGPTNMTFVYVVSSHHAHSSKQRKADWLVWSAASFGLTNHTQELKLTVGIKNNSNCVDPTNLVTFLSYQLISYKHEDNSFIRHSAGHLCPAVQCRHLLPGNERLLP
ncbi:hypothetical protein Btru_065693 [Bulinus truncatus]|nr:hypothetical protein Btru_065693 [Bulinus truncatus]